MSKPCVVLVFLMACGGGSDTPADTAPADDAPADSPVCVPGTQPATVVYLNRTGGTYTNGSAEDSSTNVTVIVPANMSPLTIPAPTIVETDWTAVRSCLDDLFSPFRITFTETDPGVAEHQEVVVIDQPQQLGLSNGVSAISPTAGCQANGDPTPILKGHTFLMWGQFGNTPMSNRGRCEVLAQGIAVTYGLDHAFSCPDVLTFLSGCGNKSFTDAEVPCGESSARNCNCGGATQNSYRHLANLVGETCL